MRNDGAEAAVGGGLIWAAQRGASRLKTRCLNFMPGDQDVDYPPPDSLCAVCFGAVPPEAFYLSKTPVPGARPAHAHV